MLTFEEEHYILTHAYVPEHTVELITHLSGGEPFLIDDFFVCRTNDWVILIGYPFAQEFDVAGFERIDPPARVKNMMSKLPAYLDQCESALVLNARDSYDQLAAFFIMDLYKMRLENPIYDLVKGMKSWLAEEYVRSYLDGDLEKMKYMRLRFHSRHHSVIDHRDQIFYDRMQEYLTQGDLVAFVGAPHVRGIQNLLLEDGYQVRRASG